jgi:hypothetical protein
MLSEKKLVILSAHLGILEQFGSANYDFDKKYSSGYDYYITICPAGCMNG